MVASVPPVVRPLSRPRRQPLVRPGWSDAVYDLDFAGGSAGATQLAAAGFAFARTGSAWDETGTAYASGVPRITTRGMLIEGARTNLALRSQEFDDAAWSKSSASVTANAVSTLDGTTSGDTLTDAGSGALIRNNATVTTVAATAYAYSVYLKRGTYDWVRLLASDVSALSPNAARAWFNLATGAVGTASATGSGFSSVSATITSAGSGWYRCSLLFTPTATTCYVAVISASADNAATRADVGGGAGIGGTLHLWQAQVEAGSFASSPIPTSGSAVTRNLETCAATRSAADLAQGSIVIAATAAAGLDVDQIVWTIDAGDANNRLSIYRNSSTTGGHLFLNNAGATQASLGTGSNSWAHGASYGLAGRWATNNVAFVGGGGTVGTDTVATLNAATVTERLGNRSATDRTFNGYLRRVRRYAALLDDATLRQLSA